MTSLQFQSIASHLLSKHNVTVVKEVSGTYGMAYWNTRNIKVPKPTGYMSFAVFCHEVGHVALGHCVLPRKKLRCLEEYKAWMFVVSTFKEFKIPFKNKVRDRMHRSLRRAVEKAFRSGLKPEKLPRELKHYQTMYPLRGGEQNDRQIY